MVKNIIVFSLGLLAAILISFVSIHIVFPGKMFVVTEIELDFEDTVNALVKSAEVWQWSIPLSYNLHSTMHQNGLETAPLMVMLMCTPVHAEKILNSKNSRPVSALLPFRAVYMISFMQPC